MQELCDFRMFMKMKHDSICIAKFNCIQLKYDQFEFCLVHKKKNRYELTRNESI